MILKDRLFKRRKPSRDAKLFIIFCEGKKREPSYFNYFKGICTRIKFEIIPAEQGGNNSPTGLYRSACTKIIQSEDNPNPKYSNDPNDEIWFVIDTDDWQGKIPELKKLCNRNHSNWNVAQSNPCFEVWLYYHFRATFPSFDGFEMAANWKSFLNDKIIPGGFDSRKHPLKIKDAIKNAKGNFSENDEEPEVGTTNVFKLASNFYPLIEKTIEHAIQRLESN